MRAKSRYVDGQQREARRAAAKVVRRARPAGTTASRPPGSSRSSTATASTPGQCTRTPVERPRRQRSPTPRRLRTRRYTTNPKIRVPSINVRVVNDGAAMPAASADRGQRTTVFVKTADALRHHVPHPDHRQRPPPPGAAWRRCPSPASRTGATSSARSAALSGHPHGHADRRTGTGSGDLRRAVDQHGRRRDRDEPRRRHHRQHDPTGTPTIAANPIYPDHARSAGTNGSIIIRLNRTGPCE